MSLLTLHGQQRESNSRSKHTRKKNKSDDQINSRRKWQIKHIKFELIHALDSLVLAELAINNRAWIFIASSSSLDPVVDTFDISRKKWKQIFDVKKEVERVKIKYFMCGKDSHCWWCARLVHFLLRFFNSVLFARLAVVSPNCVKVNRRSQRGSSEEDKRQPKQY